MENSNLILNKNDNLYFKELDGLRFFAFLFVFMHHHRLFAHISNLSFLNSRGWIGVDLFFVLSAFLFTKLLIAEYNKTQKISFKKFYIRRIFRIWPIYYLYICIAFVLFLTITQYAVSNDIKIRLIGLLTFSDNIFVSFKGWNPIFFTEHLWTISYEEQFYIFIPLIILFLIKSSFRIKIISLATVFLLFNIIRLVFIYKHAQAPSIYVLPITHYESITMGIIIGFGGLDFLLKKINSLVIGCFGIVFFLLICLLPNFDQTSYWLILLYLLVGLSTSLILFSVLNNKYLKIILSNNILVYLGKRSYGLYLYHLLGIWIADYVIIRHFHEFKLFSTSLTSFIYSLIITVLISIFSYKIIEVPFLKWKKKFEIIKSRPI